MMINLLRWFIGFVEFSFTGGFCEGFLNDCLHKGYNISEVSRNGDALTASCPAGLYHSLRSVARANGGKLKIQKKHGLVFCFLPFSTRWGLLCGVLCGVFLVCLLTSFVWQVEVTGNKTISQSEVLHLMEENGLKEGVWKNKVDKGRLESLIMATFSDCAWVNINENGTCMRIEIREGVAAPQQDRRHEYANLKATKDGVIVKAVIYDGWAVKQKGEAVTAGDILISGVYESEKKKMNLFAHAAGEYIAEVKEPLQLRINRLQREKICICNNEYRYIYFFGLKIPLFIARKAVGETDTECSYLSLNRQHLPIGIVTETVKTYAVRERRLNDKELRALAQQSLKQKTESELAEFEIIASKPEYEIKEDCIVIKGYLLCLENIGEEVKFIP